MVLEDLDLWQKLFLVLIVVMLLKIMFDVNRLMRKRNEAQKKEAINRTESNASCETLQHQMERENAIDAEFEENK
ncbi:hypothetical protein [Methanolapillus ohkumae]|uniref:Uncharacterized protein n=1 Tax=Methanolapillus ohkumae TaxID=3028298 RepID=A0AA96V7X9_9EURY|nr:hypothetical protein MsAm2_11070 [Methanosarcinaceae archaeon Am2]